MTGGGDCPGLNAAIRAIARRAAADSVDVLGIRNGWLGLVENDCIELTRARVRLDERYSERDGKPTEGILLYDRDGSQWAAGPVTASKVAICLDPGSAMDDGVPVLVERRIETGRSKPEIRCRAERRR